MARHLFYSLLLLLGAVLLASCTSEPRRSAPVVMAAASMQEALSEAADVWEERGHARPVLTFAGTSALARQVLAGAPADLFISADEEWMDELAGAGAIDVESRAVMAGNQLVLIAPEASETSVRLDDQAALQRALGDGRLAMADPDAVPAGRYGKAALQSLGLWTGIGDRITNSENVRAALALVERGEAPMGLVYASDAAASEKVRIAAVFPPESHPPIQYPLALLSGSNNADASRFRQFLLSADGERILLRHGFSGAS